MQAKSPVGSVATRDAHGLLPSECTPQRHPPVGMDRIVKIEGKHQL